MCRDHHQHFELFHDINWIHGEKYHPCPSMICVIIGNVIAPPSKSDLIMLWSSFLSSLCYVLDWSITVLHVKDIVRISPPLENSWCIITSRHLCSFLGPSLLFLIGIPTTGLWCVKFKTSGNPIACKLITIVSFLVYWLSNHHSNIDHAT